MEFISKIKNNPHPNDLGYDEVINLKQEERAIWYEGKSDKIQLFYLVTRGKKVANNEAFRNSDDYFWAVVSKELDTKCTHSGLANAAIDTLVNITGIPEISITKKTFDIETKQYKETEDIELNNLIDRIIDENNFMTLLTQDQEPYMLAIGDGAYFINYDKTISDYPIIDFLDGRNVEFERKANRITAIIGRKYYDYKDENYMLIDRRSTELFIDDNGKNQRMAVIENNLYKLENNNSNKVLKEVPLKEIPQTSTLKAKIYFKNINKILAEPCIYKLDKSTQRGKSVLDSKLDLLDDLDQNISQASITTRLSTPVEYIPNGLVEYDREGNPKEIQRYDRRYIKLPSDFNSATGIENTKIETTQPLLNFQQYNDASLEIVHNFLTGFLSPSTLGIDLARKDNATAQREKEKVTLVTRDYLVSIQTQILKRLFEKTIKFYFTINKDQELSNLDYKITINYPEYANPSFENKLSYLTPAFASGGMSAKQYVNELWGDSLSEEEKEEEIKKLEEGKEAYIPASEEVYEPFMI